jgi:hypothetical protein
MYNEWINGTPISEIVEKTGIKRKTWNKRFERHEKQLEMTTNNISPIINGDKNDCVVVQSPDNGDRAVEITRNINAINTQRPKNKFFAALAALTAVLAIFFIYLEIRKRNQHPKE